MSGIMKFRAALPLLAAVALAGCAIDDPTGPSLLNPDAAFAVSADKYGGGGGGGGGGGDEGLGNNLSWPVIFADGKGLGGQVIASATDFANTGLRPTTAETAAYAALTAAGAVPFWYAGNVAEAYTPYDVFWQKTANTWQAQWASRTGPANTTVTVNWGDNLNSVNFSTTSVIRVEHVLDAADGTLLKGYPMDVVVNPSSPSEEQGIFADGQQTATVDLTPTVFTDRARLTLQKLSGPGGTVTYTFLDKAVWESFGVDGPGGYSAEINVGGKVLYGYVWFMKKVVMPGGIAKDGWWRITFSLDAGSGATITGADVPIWSATSTSYEINIGTNKGGGGGGNPNK